MNKIILLNQFLRIYRSMYLMTSALVKTVIFHNYDLRLKLLQITRKKENHMKNNIFVMKIPKVREIIPGSSFYIFVIKISKVEETIA